MASTFPSYKYNGKLLRNLAKAVCAKHRQFNSRNQLKEYILLELEKKKKKEN